MAPRVTLLASILCIGMAGCACIASKQDWHYKFAVKQRANSAWKCCYGTDQRKCLGPDFEAGFKAGFFDTSIGKDCRVPPVAPPKYWAAKYQCCEGQAAIQDWFKGYQCGITAAESKGYHHFNDVPVSSGAPVVNRTACGKCQSFERCKCSSSVGTAIVESTAPYVPEIGPVESSVNAARPIQDEAFSPATEPTVMEQFEAAVDSFIQEQPTLDIPLPQALNSPRSLSFMQASSRIGLIGGVDSEQRIIGPFDPLFGMADPGKVISAIENHGNETSAGK